MYSYLKMGASLFFYYGIFISDFFNKPYFLRWLTWDRLTWWDMIRWYKSRKPYHKSGKGIAVLKVIPCNRWFIIVQALVPQRKCSNADCWMLRVANLPGWSCWRSPPLGKKEEINGLSENWVLVQEAKQYRNTVTRSMHHDPNVRAMNREPHGFQQETCCCQK